MPGNIFDRVNKTIQSPGLSEREGLPSARQALLVVEGELHEAAVELGRFKNKPQIETVSNAFFVVRCVLLDPSSSIGVITVVPPFETPSVLLGHPGKRFEPCQFSVPSVLRGKNRTTPMLPMSLGRRGHRAEPSLI